MSTSAFNSLLPRLSAEELGQVERTMARFKKARGRTRRLLAHELKGLLSLMAEHRRPAV